MIERLLTTHLSGLKAGAILDVGPGYSHFARIAARATGAREIVYVDCDDAVLAWQAAESARSGHRARCIAGALGPDTVRGCGGPFDLVLCQEVLEHLSNAEAVLAALAQQLTPQGRMVITVPTARSERWLKRLDPSYMEGAEHGHVRQFDEQALHDLVRGAGLRPLLLLPTQPHYFVFHTWMAASRMRVEWSTGKILSRGLRRAVGKRLLGWSQAFFLLTGPECWGRWLPRNYFVIASRQP